MVSCEQLVKDAIYIQQNRLHECVGASDAAIISRGGFAKINVSAEGNYRIQPVAVAATRLQEFQRHLLFCFMGACPSPQEVLLSEQPPDSATANGNAIDEAIAAITEPHRDIRDVGALLDQVWKQRVSNMENDKSNAILRHYEAARRAGAIGGRALGGTFGWFLLLVAHPNHHSAVWSALGKPLIVPISFDYSGTQLMLYQP
jgi:D-glycero-alpha-D-manno-heptose-7-phosphate kinase